MKRIFRKNKIVGLLSILLLTGMLVAPLVNAQEIQSDVEEKDNPEELVVIDVRLEIGPVKIRIHVEITNNGPTPEENVPWNFDCSGLCFYGNHYDGIIPVIQSEETVETDPFMVIGFGPAELTASCVDGLDSISCFLVGPFILGVTDI